MKADRQSAPQPPATGANGVHPAFGRKISRLVSHSQKSTYAASARISVLNHPEVRSLRLETAKRPLQNPFLIAVWKIRTTLYPIENNHHRPSLIAEILPPISACSRTAAGPAPPRPIPDHPTPPGAAFFAVLPAESVRSRARQRPAQVEARGAKEDN